MTPQINDIWGYLSASPLLGLAVTLLAYQAAFWLYRRSGMNPLANPVLIAVSILVLYRTSVAEVAAVNRKNRPDPHGTISGQRDQAIGFHNRMSSQDKVARPPGADRSPAAAHFSGHRPSPVCRTPDAHLPGFAGCAPAARDGQ